MAHLWQHLAASLLSAISWVSCHQTVMLHISPQDPMPHLLQDLNAPLELQPFLQINTLFQQSNGSRNNIQYKSHKDSAIKLFI